MNLRRNTNGTVSLNHWGAEATPPPRPISRPKYSIWSIPTRILRNIYPPSFLIQIIAENRVKFVWFLLRLVWPCQERQKGVKAAGMGSRNTAPGCRGYLLTSRALLLVFKFYIFVYRHFTCVYVCVPLMCLVPMEAKQGIGSLGVNG